MNPDTGEIREFPADKFSEAIKNGWVGWSVDELVSIKGCCFSVINHHFPYITKIL